MLTDIDRARVRDEIGTSEPPTDFDLDDSYDELGTWQAVALRVLQRRRADLIANPLSFTLTGVLSMSAAANIAGLDAQIRRLEAAVAVAGGFTIGGTTTGRLTRTDLPRP